MSEDKGLQMCVSSPAANVPEEDETTASTTHDVPGTPGTHHHYKPKLRHQRPSLLEALAEEDPNNISVDKMEEQEDRDKLKMEEDKDKDREKVKGGSVHCHQVEVVVDDLHDDVYNDDQEMFMDSRKLEDQVLEVTSHHQQQQQQHSQRPPLLSNRSLSPLVAAESLEDYDLPPQLMMCRRNSVTFISIPQAFQQSRLERSDTAPPGPADSYVKKGLLQKTAAVGGLEGSHLLEPRGSIDRQVLLTSPSSRRVSTSQLPFQSRHLSVDFDQYRLSRSHDDLSIRPKGGFKTRARSPVGRRSPAGTPPLPVSHTLFRRRRSGTTGGLFHPPFMSLDVPRSQSVAEEDRDDDEGDSGSPPMSFSPRLRQRRRSSANVIHRQSSGVTLCIPLHHSLSASPAETEEEDDGDEEMDELNVDAVRSPRGKRTSSAGATPLTPSSIDLSDRELSIDRSQSLELHSEQSQDLLDDQNVLMSFPEDGDETVFSAVRDTDSEEAVSPKGGRSLQKKGSIAIPLERLTDRTNLSKLTRQQIHRCLANLRYISSRFSESYFAVKGAALILPQSECPRTITRGSHGGDIQTHLQSMFYLLRPPDTIKVAVKLESLSLIRNRYMAVVSTLGRQDTEESVILGIDIEADKASIGLVLPIWGDTAITLDGDGGFKVSSNERLHIIKPVSVQAMWSALQSVIKARDTAHHNSYYPGGLTHTWIQYYEAHISSDQPAINEWNAMEDIESHRPADLTHQESMAQEKLEKLIRIKLKEIMLTVDLEEVTSKYLRTRLEEEMGMGLKDMRHFIDEEMIVILRQMDSASEIFPFLYLGSEWNASNLEELQQNGIDHILNVTREIDNFFPGLFEYSNIRVYDIENAELLKHWDNTYKFIKKAEASQSKVLVHCKMGVSRSASSVIAFAMKEYGWSLQEAFDHVKKRRSCVRPNKGFWQQLITYEGILDASKQRNSKLWRSKSVGDISEQEQSERTGDKSEDRKLIEELLDYSGYPGESSSRPRSWSPEDSTTQLLMKTHNLASDESSDEELMGSTTHQHHHYTDMGTLHHYTEGAVLATPFLASWDDCDDMSSHSMDSLLDNAQCQQGEEPTTKTIHENRSQPRVVLLSYRAFSGSEGDHGNLSDGMEVLTEESDVEDIVAEECAPPRKQRGFYDVNMLTADFLNPDVTDPDEEVPANYINYFLHPDYKMDILMAQQRKHRRIAQLLKLSQPPEDPDNYMALPQILKRDKPQHQGPTVLPQVTKLRADNSWIKDTPSSPQDSGEVQSSGQDLPEVTAEAEMVVPEVAIEVSSVPPSAALPSEKTSNSMTSTSETSPESAASKSVDEGAGESSPQSAIDSDNPTLVTGQKDIGVLQHYQKEDIPWNPGTVKRHKHDLEQRLKSKSKKKSKRSSHSSSPRMSSSSSDSGSSESLEEIQIIQPEASSTGEDRPQVMQLEGAEMGESCTDDLLPAEDVFPDDTAGNSGDNSGEGSPPDSGAERPTSIYELEDIAVEPGVVQRTKNELEKRGSVTSQEIDLSHNTIKRSSSMKEDKQTKKDRTSERRRTCTPVLHTSTSESDTGESPSKSEELMDEAGAKGVDGDECTVLQVGQETVELVEGKVQKTRRAIESWNTKCECEAVTSPESGTDPVISPGSMDITKPRSLSLPLEPETATARVTATDVEHAPQGSVLKQKKELESRLSVKDQKGGDSTTKTPEGSSSLTRVTDTKPPRGVSPLPSLKTSDAVTTKDENTKCLLGQSISSNVSNDRDESNSTSSTSGKLIPAPDVPSLSSAVDSVSLNVVKLSDLHKVSSSPELSRVQQQDSTANNTDIKVYKGNSKSAAESNINVCDADEQEAGKVSAYPMDEDIPWSVGTVRQQKEAFEKGSSSSTLNTGGDAGRSSSDKSPIRDTSDSADAIVGLSRTSSCKTYTKPVADDPTLTVARASSLKEGSMQRRSELKVSLTKPISTNAPVHVSHKDIVISSKGHESSSTQGNITHIQQKVLNNSQGFSTSSSSTKMPPELEKWSSTKEVLIVEAPKSEDTTRTITCEDTRSEVESSTEKVESSTEKDSSSSASGIKPIEEKTVRDLVGIFDTTKGDQSCSEPPIEPTTITRSKSMSSKPSATKEKTLVSRKVSYPLQSSKTGESATSEASPSGPSDNADGNASSKSDILKKAPTSGSSSSNRIIPIGVTQREPDPEDAPRKSRRLHGKSHPLSKLTKDASPHSSSTSGSTDKNGRSKNPVYNTM